MMPLYVRRTARITGQTAWLDGKEIPVPAGNAPFPTALYRTLGIDYPKFFKMDGLSKLGFLASEMILGREATRFVPREDCAVICFSRSSSLYTDRMYQDTIRPGNEYYPSPSLFVYTLPNIVTAEIAIRNKLYGETSACICETFSARQIYRTVCNAFAGQPICSALAGWTEYEAATCEACLMLIETRQASAGNPLFSVGLLQQQNINPKIYRYNG